MLVMVTAMKTAKETTATAATTSTMSSVPSSGGWVNEWGFEYRFNDGNWETWFEDIPTGKGIYTASGGTIAMAVTHLHGSEVNREWADLYPEWWSNLKLDVNKWYSKVELRSAIVSALSSMPADYAKAALAEADAILNDEFVSLTGTYFVCEDVLSLTLDGFTQVFAKL